MCVCKRREVAVFSTRWAAFRLEIPKSKQQPDGEDQPARQPRIFASALVERLDSAILLHCCKRFQNFLN
jgi:hypothetical protein